MPETNGRTRHAKANDVTVIAETSTREFPVLTVRVPMVSELDAAWKSRATATNVTEAGRPTTMTVPALRDIIRAMSHRVEPGELAETAASYGTTPYLLYTGDDGSARINHVVVESIDIVASATVVRCRGFGRGVHRRVEAGAPLALLWPAPAAGRFSLIADGVGRIDDEALSIEISAAVLHRPAPVDGDVAC